MRMNHTHFTLESNGGVTSFTFNGKPSETVRASLKAQKYRWSPSAGHWWKATSVYADFSEALSRLCDREAGIRRADGACWDCKSANGYFRRYGAATPVYCDACQAKHQETERAPYVDVDALYEDQCQAACGL
jgi:hypothetical protein